MKASDKIQCIQSHVYKQIDIPPQRQHLYFNGNYLHTNPEQMLYQCGIKHGSSVDLFEIIEIHVKYGKEEQIKLEVSAIDRIHCVKTNIQRSLGIPPQRQQLSIDGKQLREDQTLSQCGIKHNSSMDLLEKIDICVNCLDATEIPLEVFTSDKIQCIKSKIRSALAIPSKRQRLYFNGKHLRNREKRLYQCGILHGSSVDLIEVIEIHVKYGDEKQLKLDVNSSDSIECVKTNIHKSLRILPQRQHLSFGGNNLQEDQTLFQCGIKHNSSVDLVEVIEICVKYGDDKVVNLNVRSNETLGHVKKEIQVRERIPAHTQCITCGSTKLEDDEIPLIKLNIFNRCVFYLTEKQCNYFALCLEARSLLELRDDYFDFESKHNKCYCNRCHEARNESHYYKDGIGQRIYTKPIGWGRIVLDLPKRAKALKIFDQWNVAYHGTTVSAAKAILESGMLMLPGDSNLRGDQVRECVGHYNAENKPVGFNTEQIFVTPSIKYAGCEVYAKRHRMPIPSCGSGDKEIKLAFQVRIHPERFSVGHETIGRHGEIDPPIPNSEIEWSTTARDAIIPVALLIHVETRR